MDPSHVLKDKTILVVDDEPDVLETVEDLLDMCMVTTAGDYDTALQYLANYTYDVVILDIMGVNGFELLRTAVERGIPALMLTAFALTPEALEKSMRLGAVAFLPKEKMVELKTFLAEVVLGAGRPIWETIFKELNNFFTRHFGPDWRERKKLFREFEASVKEK
jgi:CheY-like chemotaxis protein